MPKVTLVALLVRIPRSLRARLKVMAAQRDVTVKELVTTSLVATLSANEPSRDAQF